MPRVPVNGKKSSRSSHGGRQNVLNMMGYDSDEDDDDDMETELAAILGEEQPKSNKKPSKLIDWSIIDAQVTASMRDVDDDDDDDDDDVTADDEMSFMSELNNLVEKEDSTSSKLTKHLSNHPSSSSPKPLETISVLKNRRDMYEKAIANAQSAGQSSKMRRLQRGVKTIDSLLRTAQAGKTVMDDDIPPVVATGQSTDNDSPAAIPQTSANVDLNTPHSGTTTKSKAVILDVSSPSPSSQLAKTEPFALKPVMKEDVSVKTIGILEKRKLEYRNAALQAKRDGDKDAALKFFKILKQFDSVLDAAKQGHPIDLSKMPSSPNKPRDDNDNSGIEKQSSKRTSNTPPVQQNQQAESSSMQPAQPAKPNTILEALEQRLLKYQSSSDQASKEGNGSKARRMNRIVKQYKDAIKSHKAGQAVNFDDLPVPPGFPPIPGIKESMHEVNLLQKANALLNDDSESEPGQSKQAMPQHVPSVAVPVVQRPAPSNEELSSQRRPSSRSQSNKPPSTRYDQQVVFLENRQAAFKQAALAAKKRGDKTEALDFLRKMKGFDDMITAAKNGLKVDITNVPQPPVESSPHHHKSKDFEHVHKQEKSSHSREHRSKKSTPEEDAALYLKLLDTLQDQLKKSRTYAQQMTQSGNVAEAERCDRLAISSQDDYDFVRSRRRHRDIPPPYYYEDQKFQLAQIKPDIGSNEMELVIVQCMDLHGASKDGKIFVEWEIPFPHERPIKSRTDDGVGSQNPNFPEAIFRVPFNRKLKSNHRAINHKSIKLDAIQKGGFLRNEKLIGTAAIKLNPLENHCEIHAVEELKDGRHVVGKVEALVRLHSPLLKPDLQTIKERWLHIEHVRQPRSSSHHRKGSASMSSPNPSSAPKGQKVNIASLEILGLELKVIDAKIANYKKRGSSIPSDLNKEARSIQQKIDTTKKFLRDGGSHARKEYFACLTRHYQHLSNEAEAFAKQGKKEQAKLSLNKKNFVQKELEKYSTHRT